MVKAEARVVVGKGGGVVVGGFVDRVYMYILSNSPRVVGRVNIYTHNSPLITPSLSPLYMYRIDAGKLSVEGIGEYEPQQHGGTYIIHPHVYIHTHTHTHML